MQQLIFDVGGARRTGRPGYPPRAMVGMVMVRALFGCSSWREAVELAAEDPGVAQALGGDGPVPSVWACYRFARRLRDRIGVVEACGARLAAAAAEEIEGFASVVSCEVADLPAFTNAHLTCIRGGRMVERVSHPRATVGPYSTPARRAIPNLFGYKVRGVVCRVTGLPVRWWFHTARIPAHTIVRELLAGIPAGARVTARTDPEWFRVPSAIRSRRELRCVPFGTRGMPATRLLVEAAILSRLAAALTHTRQGDIC